MKNYELYTYFERRGYTDPHELAFILGVPRNDKKSLGFITEGMLERSQKVLDLAKMGISMKQVQALNSPSYEKLLSATTPDGTARTSALHGRLRVLESTRVSEKYKDSTNDLPTNITLKFE
jgi:hypothetical protein